MSDVDSSLILFASFRSSNDSCLIFVGLLDQEVTLVSVGQVVTLV